MLRFKLKVGFACEGAIEGRPSVRGRKSQWYVEFRNIEGNFGLTVAEYDFINPASVHILSWYAGLLRLLFEEELRVGGKSYGQGAILKIEEGKQGSEKDTVILLWLVLRKYTHSKTFATRVFEELRQPRNPFASMYLAGLTDADIARIFVEPPLWRE